MIEPSAPEIRPTDPHLLILGSGTSHPSVDRASPALLLRCGGENTLIDIGPGTLRQLARAGIHHSSIDRIMISHFHPDHTADLIHFLFATRHPQVAATRMPFLIAGPKGLASFLDRLEKAYGKWILTPPGMMSVLEFSGEEPAPRKLGNIRVRTQKVSHTNDSLAYRIEVPGGGTVVCSGDTGPCDELIDFARGCDLLILECSFPEEFESEGHLTPSSAGELAASADAAKLLLVHFYPEVLSVDIASRCRSAFKGDLIIGRDMLAVRI